MQMPLFRNQAFHARFIMTDAVSKIECHEESGKKLTEIKAVRILEDRRERDQDFKNGL